MKKIIKFMTILLMVFGLYSFSFLRDKNVNAQVNSTYSNTKFHTLYVPIQNEVWPRDSIWVTSGQYSGYVYYRGDFINPSTGQYAHKYTGTLRIGPYGPNRVLDAEEQKNN